jgi:two-component system phosphate regulon sensor histidine kinase PhoR
MQDSYIETLELKEAGEALKLPCYLERILEEIQNKIGCKAGYILLYNEEKDKLEFKIASGDKSSEIKKLGVDVNEGIAGWVFQNGTPLLVNSTKDDGRFFKDFDISIGFETESMIAVPLNLGDRTIGVMELLNKKKGEFSRKDLNTVLSYSSISSVVIENIELYRNLKFLVNKIKKLQNYQKVLLENLKDGVMSVNLDSKIISCNRRIKRMLDEDENLIIGRNLLDFFEPEDSVKKMIDKCVMDGKISNLIMYIKKNKKRIIPVAVDASYLKCNSDKTGIVMVIRSLGNALNHEEIKRKTILKSNLVYNLAHEFNTPLTAIRSGIQLLKKEYNGNEANKYIDIIYKNAGKLKERVQFFIDYLKAEKDEWRGCFEKIELNSFLTQIIEEYRMRYPQYKFITYFPGSHSFVYVDKNQIGKVLEVIFKNAIQYSERGSTIETKLVSNEKFFKLYIKDEGCGISDSDIKFIFNKFKRFSNSIEETNSGLGIGLWLAKYLLNKNNAKISVKSRREIGTTVEILFNKYNKGKNRMGED